MFEQHERNDAWRARDLLQRNLDLNPDHEPSLHALAHFEIETRNYDAARKLLEAALRLNPAHIQSYMTLAELSGYQGAPDQARELFVKAAERCGADAMLYTRWAMVENDYGELGAPLFELTSKT